MKNAFMVGVGFGFILGAYLLKHCPTVKEAYDAAETNITQKVDECKESMKRKKQQKTAMEQGF